MTRPPPTPPLFPTPPLSRSPAMPTRGQARAGAAPPDRRNQVTIEVREGKLFYSVQRDGWAVFLPSGLGFEFRGAPPLRDSLRLADTTRTTVDETWTEPWGEVARVRDHHNELRVSVVEAATPGGPSWFVGAITDEA